MFYFAKPESTFAGHARAAQRFNQALPYLRAGAVYLSSRLVILLAVNVAPLYLPLWKSDVWQSGSRWYDHLLRWDSEWYAGILAHGYSYNGDPNVLQPVVFYPLYPLLARLVATVFQTVPGVALLIVANSAGLLALLVLFRLVRGQFGEATALCSVALVSFYPGSLFLSAGYTESLALLLVLCCFTLLEFQRYLPAAVAAALALVTRSACIALVPALLVELWRKYATDRRQFAVQAILCMLVASAGLLLYILYLGMAFGHPFAFADAQAGFQDGVPLARRFLSALALAPFLRLRFDDFSPAGLDQWFFFLLLGLTLLGWRRRPLAYSVFALGVLAVPYLTLSGGPAGFTSMTRFGVLAFPAFVTLADFARRSMTLMAATLGLFGGILSLHAALFAQWYWVG